MAYTPPQPARPAKGVFGRSEGGLGTFLRRARFGAAFLFFLITQTAFAVGLMLPTPHLGFYAKGDATIPAAVEAAGQSIFRIELEYWRKIPQESYAFFIDNPKASEGLKEKLSQCQAEGEAICYVPFGQIRGTAFLDEDPSYLWTNCHLVNAWMEGASRGTHWQSRAELYSFYHSTPLPFTLTDRNNTEVASDLTNPAIVATFSPQRGLEGFAGGCKAEDDMVKIQLSQPLQAQGLRRAKKASPSQLYIGGFPKPTENRHHFGLQDSDGESFYWTQGPHLDKKSAEGMSYLQQMPHVDFAIAGTYLSLLLSDGVEGMSGGPVLNEAGEVTGIYRGYLPQKSELGGDIPFASMFFTTHGMRFLELLSGP